MFQMETPYLFLIFIMYAVFRFSFTFVFLTLVIGDIIAVGTIMATTTGFNTSFSLNLLSIQMFISITAIIALFLNASVQGRLVALKDLELYIESQEETIKEQTYDLRKSENRFRELFSNMHTGVVIYQAANDGDDFLISDLNQAAEHIEDVVKEDIIGHSILEIFPGSRDYGIFQAIKDVWITGEARQYPVSFYFDEKRSGWRDNFLYKLQNGEVVIIFDDVTKRIEDEKRLIDTKEWLQFTQQAAKAGSWDWDLNKKSPLNCNNEFKYLFGLPETAKPTYETWLEIIHPDDMKSAVSQIDQAIEEKIDLWVEYRVRLPDGQYRWIGATGRTTYNEDNAAVRMSGICLDISQIKEAEEALRKSEERLKYTMEAIDDGYWDWDIPSGQTYFNPRWYTMLGYIPYELPQSFETLLSLLHPDDLNRFNSAVSSHLDQSIKQYSVEFRLRKKDGNYIWILSRGSVVVRDENKNPLRMVGTHTDISHRKEVEDKLRESEKRYRSLIDNVPDLILVHQAGIIKYVNPAAIYRMGYAYDELINTSIAQYIAPEYQQMVRDAIRKRNEGEEIEPYEIEILMKTGERKNVVVRGTVISYQGSISSLNVLTDITEQKKVENNLRNFNEKLEAEVEKRTKELNKSLREKEVLLKEIHHRVKNNMQVVSSLLFVQARDVKEPEIRNILLESQNRIRSIALVHEELYQSKDLEQIDYSDYLNKISRHIFETFLINPNQITLEIRSNQVYIPIDKAVPCSLVVNELFSNSLKYSFPDGKAGKIWISFTRDKNYTLIFEDDGIGIPEEITFDSAKTLGFHLIKGLINQLNGTIQLERTGGTRYVITFPI